MRIPGGEFPVVNDGTIEGGQFGVYLNGHGSVDNSGLITGTTAAVYFDAAAGVILNRASGTIGSVLFGAFTPAQIDDFGTLGMVTFSNSLPSYAHNIVTVEPGASLAGLGNTLVAGDTIELAATIVQYVTFGSNNMLTLSGGATLDLAQGAGRIQVSNDGINTFITACFAQGTRIATSRGPVAVEALCEGDRLLTASGRLAPVRWLGHRRTDLKRHPSPHDVMPVRVTAGAFGPSLPSRDLVLSPDHAVFVDGHLVPVRHLVNGASIVQETRASITYWHVELDRHDVILAEGLPCESYLDTGNRHAFEGGSALALHPDFGRDHALGVWAEQGCAPILTEPSAPALRTVHLRLLARAA